MFEFCKECILLVTDFWEHERIGQFSQNGFAEFDRRGCFQSATDAVTFCPVQIHFTLIPGGSDL
jgi:hypothetical protein